MDDLSHVWKDFDVRRIPGSLTPGHLLESLGVGASSWLDIGAGCRPIWSMIRHWRGIGVAVDINATALASAARRFPQFGYVCADATRLPLRTDCFDVVSMLAMLTVLPAEGKEALWEAIRVLKRGGSMYICDFLYDPLNAHYAARYRETESVGVIVARGSDGDPIYRAKHWTLEEIDWLLEGKAIRKISTVRPVQSRSGYWLTGFEAIYEKV
jgi:ubiquinone/menaquinone biosynthesis C-methylase UbiE